MVNARSRHNIARADSRSRDLARTRARILAAALAEFSAKGFAGARTDAIARRARVNKRMLFYCFGAKQDLYREVLRAKIADKASTIEATPDDFVAALEHWYDFGCGDLDWIRMLEWEALEGGGARMIAHRERRELFLKTIARLKRSQARSGLPADLDLTQLFITIIALTAFPSAFPQMTRLVSGMPPTHPSFIRKRKQFLRWLGEQLCRPAASHAEPRQGVAVNGIRTAP